MKKAVKVTLNVLGGLAIVATFCTVIYLDAKVNEMDEAMFQHMKDEYNEKVMKNACHKN